MFLEAADVEKADPAVRLRCPEVKARRLAAIVLGAEDLVITQSIELVAVGRRCILLRSSGRTVLTRGGGGGRDEGERNKRVDRWGGA